jgi:putative transcriptional regulator
MASEAFEAIREGLDDAIAYTKGDSTRGRASRHPTAEIDVAAIRRRTGMSQARFCATVGVSRATLIEWERGRRQPTGPARVLLKLIERNPDAVLAAAAE